MATTEEEMKATLASQITSPTLAPEATQTALTTQDVVGTAAMDEALIDPTTATVTQTQAAPVVAAETTTVAAPVVTEAAQTTAVKAAPQVEPAVAATKESIDARAQVVAEQGELSPEALAVAEERQITAKATVQGQLDAMFANVPAGETPAWAKPAVAQVEAMLAQRGMGQSSVAKEQLYNAIISSAMPIAQADAQAEREVFLTNLNNKNKEIMFNAANVANMDMTNLNNRQIAAVENAKAFLQLDFTNLSNEQQSATLSYQAKQQALMTDAAAQNAANQFNASSQNQTDQFFANMATQIELSNSARSDAMAQFNTTNAVNLNQFNASMQDSVKKFNAQNALVIEQANTAWRRQVNTADTVAANEANRVNAQNSFNISNQALTFLWQEMRDEANWGFQAGEAALTREMQEAIVADEASAKKEAALYQAIGALGADLFSAYVSTGGFGATEAFSNAYLELAAK